MAAVYFRIKLNSHRRVSVLRPRVGLVSGLAMSHCSSRVEDLLDWNVSGSTKRQFLFSFFFFLPFYFPKLYQLLRLNGHISYLPTLKGLKGSRDKLPCMI